MSEEESKLECINFLHELIKDIEEDTISYNYFYGFDVLENQLEYDGVKRRIRYIVERTEYFKKQNNYE